MADYASPENIQLSRSQSDLKEAERNKALFHIAAYALLEVIAEVPPEEELETDILFTLAKPKALQAAKENEDVQTEKYVIDDFFLRFAFWSLVVFNYINLNTLKMTESGQIKLNQQNQK